MAAFRLIPRIAPLTVVTLAHIFEALDSFAHHAGVEQLRRIQVLDSSPGLCVIRKRDSGARYLPVIADQYGCLVIQGVDALYRIVLGQVAAVVVFINGRYRLANVCRIEQRTETGDIREILSDQLVR